MERERDVALALTALAVGLVSYSSESLSQTTVRAPLLTPDPIGIWTIQGENASITTSGISDRYYTNGLRIGFTSGTGAVPQPLATLGGWLFGSGQSRYSIDVSQQIFNAYDTTTGDPPPGDRPFAGVLMANFGLWQDTATSRGMLGIGVGLVGPDALGEQVQNNFHDLIGQGKVEGWETQLPDQPLFQLTAGKTWRQRTGTVFGLETDALLDASAGVGLERIYGEGGGQLRIGSGLNSDFGVSRVLPGPSGGDVFRPVQPFVWYLFAGVDGQVVGYDVTLNGTLWRDSRSVTPLRPVGEGYGGLALMAYGVRLTYTQVVQSQEFQHQKGGAHQFGSLALSVRF